MKKSWFFLCILLCLSVFVLGQAAKKEKAAQPYASPTAPNTPLDLGKAAYIRWQESGSATDAEKLLIRDYLRYANPSALETDNLFKIAPQQEEIKTLSAEQLEYQNYAAQKERYYILLEQLDNYKISSEGIAEIYSLCRDYNLPLPQALQAQESEDNRNENPLDNGGPDCTGAVVIPSCPFSDTGTYDGDNDCSVPSPSPSNEVFYTFTPSSSGFYQFRLRHFGTGAPAIRVMSVACCTGGTSVAFSSSSVAGECGEPTTVVTYLRATLNAGQQYWIHVGTSSGTAATFAYEFSMTCVPCPPDEPNISHSTCAAAIPIACNDSLYADSAITANPDWYSFSVAVSESVYVYVGGRALGHCNSGLYPGNTSVDGRYTLYADNCMDSIGFSDDEGCSFDALKGFYLTPGTYKLKVWNLSVLDYVLKVTCIPPAFAPDLSTSNLAPCGTQPLGAQLPSMRVTNNGLHNAGPTFAHYLFDGFGPIDNIGVPPLAPNSFFDVFFNVPINLTLGSHTLRAYVDMVPGDVVRGNDTTTCTITVACPNDNCSNATLLSGSLPLTASCTTVGAVNDFSLVPLGFPASAPPCWIGFYSQSSSCNGPDLTYRWIPSVSGTYRISLCATGAFDTGLLVFRNTCPAMPTFATDYVCGNDDSSSCTANTLASSLDVPLVGGQEYLIVVDGYSTNAGPFTLTISDRSVARCCYGNPQAPSCTDTTLTQCNSYGGTWSAGLSCANNPCPIPPPNDDCTNPIALPLVPNGLLTVSGSTAAANVTCTDTCDFVSSSPDLFYSFTVASCRRIDMNLTGGDMHLSVYNNGQCCSHPALYCNDDHANFTPPAWADPLHQPTGTLESYMGFELNAGTYIIRVGRFGTVSGAFTLNVWDNGACANAQEDTVYTIPDVYFAMPSIIGDTVNILCETTSDSLLVAADGLYERNNEMPLYTTLKIVAGTLSFSDQDGVTILATGVIGIDPSLPTGQNGIFEFIRYIPVVAIPKPILPNWRTDWTPSPTCDTCKFAMLISGGINSRNNRPDYFDDLVDYYCYKRTHGWCETGTKVFYYQNGRIGDHRDARIPAGRIEDATQANIQAWITALAAKITACRDAGQCPQMEVVVSNHGKSGAAGGVNLLDANVLSPADFTTMMQTLVDAGLCKLDCEFGQCFSGLMTDHLRNNLNTRGCNVTASSATDAGHASWSRPRPDGGGTGTGYNQWLFPKACALANGKSIHEAVKEANKAYDGILPPIAARYGALAQYYDYLRGLPDDSLRARFPGRSPAAMRRALQMCADEKRQDSTDVAQSIKGEQYWRAIPFTQYCQWDTFQVTPGGYIDLTFSGDAQHCGNSTVYCQDTTGRWKKFAVWNWNIPNSCRYADYWTSGTRTLVSGGAASGLYTIHNDDGIFTVKAKSVNIPDGTKTTSASNGQGFAGFSMGGRTETSSEFGNMTGNISVTDAIGLDLSTLPSTIGLFGASLTVTYSLPAQNQWWEDMEVWIKVLSVTGADLGGLRVQASNASLPDSTYIIPAIQWIGELRFPVGAISGTGNRTITLSGTAGFNIRMDAWGLRTRVSNAGKVNNLTIIRNGLTNDLVLNWTAATCGNNYLVQTSNSEAGPWNDLATVNGLATTTYTHTNGFVAVPKRFYRVLVVY